MTDTKPTRPEIGSVTTKITRLKVCKSCGCLVEDVGGCSYGCDNDYEHHPGTYFWAKYEVTHKFLGDEEGK